MSNTENTPTQTPQPEINLSPDLDETFAGPVGAKIIPFPEGGREGNEQIHYDGDPTPPHGMERPETEGILFDEDVSKQKDEFENNIEAIATEPVDSDHPVIKWHRENEKNERAEDLNQLKPRLTGREPGITELAKTALSDLGKADMDNLSKDAFDSGLVDKLGPPPDENKLKDL